MQTNRTYYGIVHTAPGRDFWTFGSGGGISDPPGDWEIAVVERNVPSAVDFETVSVGNVPWIGFGICSKLCELKNSVLNTDGGVPLPRRIVWGRAAFEIDSESAFRRSFRKSFWLGPEGGSGR